MKGTRHSEEQIIAILKQGEAGLTTAELCRQHGNRWKAKYGGMDSGEANAFRVSAADGDAGAGRNADQPQARVPALPRGRFGDEDSATAADPLEGRGNEPSRHEAE